MIPISCKKCRGPVTCSRREYRRQFKKGRKYFFCSLSCSSSFVNTTTYLVFKKCLWCKKEFESSSHVHSKKCCSNICARRYTRSCVDENKHKLACQLAYHSGGNCRVPTYPREKQFQCVICDSDFIKLVKYGSQKFQTCSKDCYKKLMKKKAINNPNCGGETGYRKYKYNDIWMDSRWEVNLAEWMDNKNIKWERSRREHMFWWTDEDGQRRRYYPDFYLPELNVYLDPKNKYKMKKDQEKMDRVKHENNINLIWGILEDVKKEIDILG